MDEELEEIEELKQAISNKNSQDEHPDYIFVKENSSDEYSDTSSEEEDDESDIERSLIDESIPFDTTYSEYSLKTLEPHLTLEQLVLIKSCDDPKLQQLLIINRFKKLHLNKLFLKYDSLMHDVHKKIVNVKKQTGTAKILIFPSARMSYPYFMLKDKKSCPLNADAIIKKERGEVNLNYFTKKKVMFAKMMIDLRSKVMLHYYKNKLRDYEEKLKIAKGKLKLKGEGEAEVFEWQLKYNQFEKNFNKMEPPERWNDDCIDWDDIQGLFTGSNTALSCRALWNMLVHPDINRKNFTTKEHNKLIDIAIKYKFQNWEKIANELNTNRSAYQVCVTTQSSFAHKPYERFTTEEDKQLLEVVNNCRIGGNVRWSKVCHQIANRSKLQLYNRYRNLKAMELQQLKLGNFSDEEDILLLCLVKRYGENNFDKVQEHMPHRHIRQLKCRYNDNLSVLDEKHMGNWTVDEDEHIYKFVKTHGKKWIDLSKTMTSRYPTHLRHRYNLIRRYIDHQKCTFAEMPRRSYDQSKLIIKRKQTKSAVEEFLSTNVLPSINVILERSKSKQFYNKRKRTEVDEELADFFRETSRFTKAKQLRAISEEQLNHTSNVIQTVLNMLGVTLDIPDVASIDDPIINKVDKEILIALKKNKTEIVPSYIPPNVNTIQALRCLLLKYQKYRIEVQAGGDYGTPDYKSRLLMESFRKRMMAIFRWPCMMSVREPPCEVVSDINLPKYVSHDINSPPPKRFKGRPKKDMSKINIMNKAKKEMQLETITSIEQDSIHFDEPDGINLPPLETDPDINIEPTITDDYCFEFDDDDDIDDPDYVDSISIPRKPEATVTQIEHVASTSSKLVLTEVPKPVLLSGSKIILKPISKPASIPVSKLVLSRIPNTAVVLKSVLKKVANPPDSKPIQSKRKTVKESVISIKDVKQIMNGEVETSNSRDQTIHKEYIPPILELVTEPSVPKKVAKPPVSKARKAKHKTVKKTEISLKKLQQIMKDEAEASRSQDQINKDGNYTLNKRKAKHKTVKESEISLKELQQIMKDAASKSQDQIKKDGNSTLPVPRGSKTRKAKHKTEKESVITIKTLQQDMSDEIEASSSHDQINNDEKSKIVKLIDKNTITKMKNVLGKKLVLIDGVSEEVPREEKFNPDSISDLLL